VLVPLDGSRLASDALDHALAVFDCRITVLNIVRPLDKGMSEGAPLAIDQDRIAEAEKRATHLIAESRGRVGPVDQPIETVIETGDPAETILATVESRDIDHIVMGSHGGESSELQRRLLGTVSTAVLGAASIPVTVIR